jgi:putative hydrolase of the HAD superfamily
MTAPTDKITEREGVEADAPWTRAMLITRIRALCTPLEPRPTAIEPRLGRLAGIRAVLFDVYGTLLISASGDIGLGGERARTRRLGEILDAAEFEASVLTETQRQRDLGAYFEAAIRTQHAQAQAQGIRYPEVDILALWATLLAEVGLRPTPQALQRIAVEYECRINPVWPMPGLADLLTTLHQRGLKLGIVSNAQFYTPLILEALLGHPLQVLGLAPALSAWSYALGEAKPSTRPYEVALHGLIRQHGLRPNQVLYVGNDRRNDIWPARQLGMRTALFAGDARSLRLREQDPALDGVNPDRVLTELAQIAALQQAALNERDCDGDQPQSDG